MKVIDCIQVKIIIYVVNVSVHFQTQFLFETPIMKSQSAKINYLDSSFDWEI